MDGWARNLFERINTSWPNSENVLYNLGVPGGSLIPSIVACPLTYVNFQVDLVLVDLLTTHEGVHERLLRDFLSRPRPPVMFLVDFFVNIVDRKTGNNANGVACKGRDLRNTSQTLLSQAMQ